MTGKRVPLGGGKWFDPTSCSVWEQTKKPMTIAGFHSQRLYLTKRGAWVLHTWLPMMMDGGSYELIEATAAYAWLLDHGHVDAIPPETLDAGEV